MGVVHSMDDEQVHRVSNALKESATAIQGINEKFDVVDTHWRGVQHFNEKINVKVEGALNSFQRLDSNFTERFEIVLQTLAGATDELTDALENTLFALERFDMRREMNQLPKAVIPLAIPLILLLIELAVANAYLGILISSMVENRNRGYATYLLGNAGMVLLGLMLSLVWLGVYRVWLSHKSKKRQKRAKEQAAIEELEKDDSDNSDSPQVHDQEAMVEAEPSSAMQLAKSSGSAPATEDMKREELRKERLEKLQELRMRTYGAAESESASARKISSDVLRGELLRRTNSDSELCATPASGAEDGDGLVRRHSHSDLGQISAPPPPPKSPVAGHRVPLPLGRRSEEGGAYISEQRSSSGGEDRGAVERRVSPTASEASKRPEANVRQQRLNELRQRHGEERQNTDNGQVQPSALSKTATGKRPVRSLKPRSGPTGASASGTDCGSAAAKGVHIQGSGGSDDPFHLDADPPLAANAPVSMAAPGEKKRSGGRPQLSWSSGLSMNAHWLFSGDKSRDTAATIANSPHVSGTSP